MKDFVSSPKRRRSILFLSHSASRNGASILLLHLLQWLHANADFELDVLFDAGGPLLNDFEAVAHTRVWRNPLFLLRAIRRPWARAVQLQAEGPLMRARLAGRRFDLVYANTAATWNQVAVLGRCADAVMWHVHELTYALKLSLGSGRGQRLLPTADRVIAVSQAVADSLVSQFAVSRDRVDMIHGFVPACELSGTDRESLRLRVLAELGWPADVFVVGACGGLGWRKGSDLFLQVARRVRSGRLSQRVRFLWVGGGNGDTEAFQFQHDLAALGLGSVCRQVAATADVYRYYCAMDVLALTSREDPFPLVMLEAGLHGVPTVCFAGSGGGPEFVAGGAGLAVPYLDLDAFAAAIACLEGNAPWRASVGEAARQKVLAHHGIDTQGPKLLQSIERCLAGA